MSVAEHPLQVMTVVTLLSQPLCLSGPILVSPIPNPEVLLRLVKHLQQLPRLAASLTLIQGALESLSETDHLSLTALEAQSQTLKYPCSLYLPVPPPPNPTQVALQELVEVVARLRHPTEGCPWDLAQTPESLIPYIIEEAYEVVDALRRGQPADIAEELGDLLLQVVLQSQLASEQQQFTLQEVATGIATKLIRRHPHVFANLQVSGIDEVHQNWEQIKAAEKGGTDSSTLSQKLEHYLRTLPPLLASLKISARANTVGLDWPDLAGVWGKFYEELAEFQEALVQGNRSHQEAELGDLLFTLVTLARWCQLDPSLALQSTCERFIQRLQKIEAAIDRPLEEYNPAEREALWKQAKVELNQA